MFAANNSTLFLHSRGGTLVKIVFILIIPPERLQCYHTFSEPRHMQLSKKHHKASRPRMVPTNPSGSWPNCEKYCDKRLEPKAFWHRKIICYLGLVQTFNR